VRFLLVIVFFIFSIGFISAQELPTGTFAGTGFSLEKNGSFIFTNKDLHYHNSHLKIRKVSEDLYELIISIYLQKSKNSKTVRDTRVDKYKIEWIDHSRGVLINQKPQYSRERSEFLISSKKLIIKSQISRNGVIETQSYKIK
tara:strand:- start:1137 stop:1565 length:429 start_codon:yes stop_codon:yes gene_type:complete